MFFAYAHEWRMVAPSNAAMRLFERARLYAHYLNAGMTREMVELTLDAIFSDDEDEARAALDKLEERLVQAREDAIAASFIGGSARRAEERLYAYHTQRAIEIAMLTRGRGIEDG